jgi:hypothetical protein
MAQSSATVESRVLNAGLTVNVVAYIWWILKQHIHPR